MVIQDVMIPYVVVSLDTVVLLMFSVAPNQVANGTIVDVILTVNKKIFI
jgi:hypothetical protein